MIKTLSQRLVVFSWGVLAASAPLSAAPQQEVFTAARQIDALLAEGWKQNGVQPNLSASDEVFVRRVYLDIAGRIPTAEEARDFLGSKDSAKREVLIDRLLASDGYVQHMFNFWADLLRIQSRANGGQGEMTSQPYLEHVRDRTRANQPYDQFVRELLSAQGKVWENPAIGYYMRDIGMPLDNLAATSRIFLGTRIECAQCHNHPFDKWTQMQFYQMAAFTYPLETNYTGIAGMDSALDLKRKADWQREGKIKKGKPEEQTAAQKEAAMARWMGKALDDLGDFVRYSKVRALDKRQLKLPHDYQYKDSAPHAVIRPATMMGPPVQAAPGSDTAAEFAKWMTSPDNPRFTLVIANRLWKRAFGMGLIEPVDEIFDGTVASNPPLMKHLEQLMKDLRYDLKAFQRVLYHTQTYQREVTKREIAPGEAYHFTGPLLRRMTAEQIWDSFVTLINVTPDLPRRPGMDADTAARIAYKAKLSDALDTLTSQELFDGSFEASRAYETISVRAKGLRDEYAAAQKAKDKEKTQKLGDQIRSLEYIARSSVNDQLVVPAVARLYTQKTGEKAPPPIPDDAVSADGTMMMSASKKRGGQRKYIAIPGYEPGQEQVKAEFDAADARMAIFKEEAKHLHIPETELTKFLGARRGQSVDWVRAANLESPSPRGHYLREFGQSDRDLIENANSEASMPQALVLMNSLLFSAIIQPYTPLKLALRNAASPDEQSDAIYLALLARKPTDAERVAWRRSGVAGAEDLIYALINTQQFIFVQ